MERRLELHELLCEILGSRNVYFQPPESIKMRYPAIRYSLEDISTKHANGKNYMITNKYMVTVIDDDPDSDVIRKMLTLEMCSFNRSYTSDGLNHYVFELYY